MKIWSKALLTAALVLVAMWATSGAAVASSYSISPGGAITAVSAGLITFETSAITVTCNLTLTGRYLIGPITVERRMHIGDITGVSISGCTNGSISAVLNLNWAMDFIIELEFRNTAPPGVLPPEKLTGVLRESAGVGILFSVFGVECLYEGTIELLAELTHLRQIRREWEYALGRLLLLPATARVVRGGLLCPATGQVRGSFQTVTPRQTLTVE